MVDGSQRSETLGEVVDFYHCHLEIPSTSGGCGLSPQDMVGVHFGDVVSEETKSKSA
jgi:hypothetical protein